MTKASPEPVVARTVASPPTFMQKRALLETTRKRRKRNALITTLILHLAGGFPLTQLIHDQYVYTDVIHVEMVELPAPKRQVVRPEPRPVKVKPIETANSATTFNEAKPLVKIQSVQTNIETPPALTDATGITENLSISPDADTLTMGDTHTEALSVEQTGTARTGGTQGDTYRRSGGKGSGFDSFRKGKKQGEKPDLVTIASNDRIKRIDDETLGAILEGDAAQPSGHIRIIRLKHSLSDWWQDPTAIPSFAKWLQENTQLRADMTYAGGALPLTDDRILNAPLVIMTGHDKDIAVGKNLDKEDGPLAGGFTRAELAQLRKYIVERGGMLFFDDCGFNGNFAALVQNELQRALPEYPLRNIDHTHEIYTVYYQLPRPPDGGDVFWGNLNKGDSGGYFPGESKFRFQKGITINRRLAVLYNRKDYMCSMETAEVGSRALLSMRRSNDVHRFMTNLLIYQMRYGGNTDRTNFR